MFADNQQAVAEEPGKERHAAILGDQRRRVGCGGWQGHDMVLRNEERDALREGALVPPQAKPLPARLCLLNRAAPPPILLMSYLWSSTHGSA